MSKCIVVGGGAAGMTAAYFASFTKEVVLLEKNDKLGKKIFITGKGRCNITNDCEDTEFFKNIVTNSKFLYSAYYQFTQQNMMQLLENAGCRLKTERGNRVFPVSDHSSDVIAALGTLLKKQKVQIRLHTEVKKLVTENETITGVILNSGEKIEAEDVILATGGRSYPSTGSTGDGFSFAYKTGHQLVKTRPALIPLVIQQEWCRQLQGLSLKNVKLTLKNEKKILYQDFGEMIFTHFGVSGPIVLSASSFYQKLNEGKEAELTLDLKPALEEQQLDNRLIREFEENHNKQFKNSLGNLFPAKLIPVMIILSKIDPQKPVHEITREERKSFVHLIKNLSMTVTGTRPIEEAIITQGGVAVKDINPSTMESKRIKHLYFAGEMIDTDALTGGFNLQIAWSTGALAGNSIQ